MKRKKAPKSERKSPSQERSRALVDALLESAARILKTSEYSKSSTNRIAEIAGVSVGSLYQYFPGKEALVAALVDRQVKKNLDRIEQAIDERSESALAETLDAVCAVAVELFLKDAPFFKKLFTMVPQLEKTQSIIATRTQAEARLADLLKRHRKDLSAEEARARAFIATHATMGVIQFCGLAGLPSGWSRARLTDELRVLLRGYLVE
ncbi:MAG: TetR/AcrR family transcriptional regulator [Bdellovibrionales bacterium]|nr:TetR/AcrR family transcriptional regulator [Bdellovibrionales bacterium]